jgi:hypothetical protein
MIRIERANRTGLVDAEPASMNDMFIRAPKKAAIPVSAPKISAIPTSSSPTEITFANQLAQPLSSMNWTYSRNRP